MNLYPLIARKVERDSSVLDTALDTLKGWEAREFIRPARAAQWRRILRKAKRGKDGMNALLTILRDDSEASMRLKNFAPFAGVLTREERRKVFLKCPYDHP